MTPHLPRTIALREFEACEVTLSTDAYTALRVRYAGRIDVTPTERGGVYRVAARDYIGRVGLPGGELLVIHPRIDVANLFYMLCAQTGLAQFNPPPTGLDSSRDDHNIASFVAAALLDAVERLLKQGVYRGYIERQESMEPVRGRIVTSEQISRYGDLKHRHVCAYAELTADTPENRVIAAALRYIPHLLDSPAGPNNALVRQARENAGKLEGVSVVGRAEAISLLRTVSLHRLNAAYGPVLGLCRLLLQHLSFHENPGSHPFASFLVNMPMLFESFLTTRLRTLLPGHGLRALSQLHDYLDEERTVGIRPDLLVFAAHGKEPLLVLDFKYRRIAEPGSGINRDLYQLSAYMDRYKLRPGVLVYPRFDDTPDTRFKLKGTGKHLQLAKLDLAAPGPLALEAECAHLAATIAEVVRAFPL